MPSIADQLEAAIREHVRDRLPAVSEFMVEDTRAACSRRTGALADSIMCDPWTESGDAFTTTISAGRSLENPDVARYQEEGTGIFSPEGGRIFPTTARVLVFDWPARGGLTFARSVAGAPGTHYFYGPSGDAMDRRFSQGIAVAF